MAHIEPRKTKNGTTYKVRYFDDGKRRSMTFPTMEGAKKFRGLLDRHGAQVAVRIIQARVDSHNQQLITVADAIAIHLSKRTVIGERTKMGYLNTLRWVEAHPISEIPVDVLEPEDVAAWVGWLTEQHSPRFHKPLSGKTIKNIHGDLSAALKTVLKGKPNPAKGIPLPRTANVGAVALTTKEWALLRSNIPPEGEDLADFLIASAARFSEATALTVKDVRERDGVPGVHINRAWNPSGKLSTTQVGPVKNEASVRFVGLDGNTMDMLNKLCYGKDLNDLVFTRPDGTPIFSQWWHDKIWIPARKKAIAQGLRQHPRVHDLRHTHATWLLERGVPLDVVRRRLGHAHISTTIHQYGHITEYSQGVAVKAFETALNYDSAS